MELNYIWVKEFKILQEFQINIGDKAKYTFNFNGENLIFSKTKKTVISYGKNISSITAIIGKNGSGKSTVCELINFAMATMVNGQYQHQEELIGIFCLGEFILHHHSINLKNSDQLESIGYRVIEYEESPFKDLLGRKGVDFYQHSYIYYSNTLDLRTAGWDLPNLKNLSTSYMLLHDDRFSPHKNYSVGSKKGESWDSPNGTKMFFIEEWHREASFVVEHSDKIPFSVPKIDLTILYYGNCNFLNVGGEEDLPWLNDFVSFPKNRTVRK